MTGYQIDLDTKHSVIRLTVKEETVTEELAEDMYRHLMEVMAKGGPYAAIYDLTTTKHTTINTDSGRSWGRHRRPAVPHGVCPFCGHPRKHVVVGTEPHIHDLARVIEMCADAIGTSFDVVPTMAEAYEIVEDSPENFSESVLVEELA